ncbi:MAG: hypothetical protein GYA36_16575 [Veillonellaceae bacterium]|nr:hypothetical protein [Veillonellaceae bacterium]
MLNYSVKIFGPTDQLAFASYFSMDGNTYDAYRSDYLDKLIAYIDDHNTAMVKPVCSVGVDSEARGSNVDHPYVTIEDGVKRALRYVAVVGGTSPKKVLATATHAMMTGSITSNDVIEE